MSGRPWMMLGVAVVLASCSRELAPTGQFVLFVDTDAPVPRGDGASIARASLRSWTAGASRCWSAASRCPAAPVTFRSTNASCASRSSRSGSSLRRPTRPSPCGCGGVPRRRVDRRPRRARGRASDRTGRGDRQAYRGGLACRARGGSRPPGPQARQRLRGPGAGRAGRRRTSLKRRRRCTRNSGSGRWPRRSSRARRSGPISSPVLIRSGRRRTAEGSAGWSPSPPPARADHRRGRSAAATIVHGHPSRCPGQPYVAPKCATTLGRARGTPGAHDGYGCTNRRR